MRSEILNFISILVRPHVVTICRFHETTHLHLEPLVPELARPWTMESWGVVWESCQTVRHTVGINSTPAPERELCWGALALWLGERGFRQNEGRLQWPHLSLLKGHPKRFGRGIFLKASNLHSQILPLLKRVSHFYWSEKHHFRRWESLLLYLSHFKRKSVVIFFPFYFMQIYWKRFDCFCRSANFRPSPSSLPPPPFSFPWLHPGTDGNSVWIQPRTGLARGRHLYPSDLTTMPGEHSAHGLIYIHVSLFLLLSFTLSGAVWMGSEVERQM